GIRTKLNRRLSAEDRSFTPRSRLFAVAMMEKPGWANTMLSVSSSGMETYFSDRIEISASCTSLVARVSSSNRPTTACSIAVMIGDGIIDSRDCPRAMTMETFQEYLMWSSVVPAVPCTTSVELRQIAAASSSASQLLPVPGSPISSRPRSEASVTMLRSTKLPSPNHFCSLSRPHPSLRAPPSTPVGAPGAEDDQPSQPWTRPPRDRLRAVVHRLQPVELLGVFHLGGGAQHLGHLRQRLLGRQVLR